ncbi:ParB/RepB/Spo0J family partition protein [Reinekea marinisedimentorum]|uniref:Probable chromosome-partitioning protein ParB n=1 Tax=Reinekea marinisedimentorum TaxID=230495 RepID=A0A4R3IGB3_9GAMM|nr:ParB/RepB/Spo0J family partition protein [Reinekea marinisedimentorum]TCS44052.1 ParB family chromosome partitioning protein [Reinekea marinisedimentorum]
MSPKKKGLGRNFGSLITTQAEVKEITEQPVEKVKDATLKELPIEWLQRGVFQPRRDMSEEGLKELADSIRAQGVMQPVVVRPLGPQSYELIAGERRWRAAQLAGLETIPAVIRDVADEDAIAMALIENIQRENLNPIEEAIALQRLQKEFELTQAQVAEAVGKSRTAVTNLLRLIGLESEVKTMLEHGDLEMGHARALLGLNGRNQIDAARQVVAKGMNVRQTEALVRSLSQPDKVNLPKNDASNDVNIQRLEQMLSSRLGAAVQIKHGAGGKGSLTIKYTSLDELDGILAHVK